MIDWKTKKYQTINQLFKGSIHKSALSSSSNFPFAKGWGLGYLMIPKLDLSMLTEEEKKRREEEEAKKKEEETKAKEEEKKKEEEEFNKLEELGKIQATWQKKNEEAAKECE